MRFFKHLSFVILGLFLIFIFSSINEQKLFNLSPYLFIFSLITLFLVPVIGVEVNNAQRWIDLFFFTKISANRIGETFSNYFNKFNFK